MADTPVPPTVSAAVATAEAAVKSTDCSESLLTKVKPYLYAAAAALVGFVIGHYVK